MFVLRSGSRLAQIVSANTASEILAWSMELVGWRIPSEVASEFPAVHIDV